MNKYDFRAWDGRKMHYGIVPWHCDFCISLGWHKCERSTGSGFLGSGGNEADFLVPGIRFKKIMQFTGIKDQNNAKIYEDDIVTFWGGIGRVVYFDDYAAFKIQYTEFDLTDLNIDSHTIVGNIYENEKLLILK